MNNIIPLRAGEQVDLGSFEIVKYENGIYEFAGLSKDIGKLPVVDAVKSGSNAYCIDTGEVYMYEKSSNSWFKQPSNGTNETVVQSLSVTENGSYNAGTGKAYNPVTVNVPEKTVTPLEVTANGTYNAGNNAAYNPVVVNVPQEGGGGSGGDSVPLYAWVNGYSLFVYTLSATPSAGDDAYGGDPADLASRIRKVEVTEVGENTITITDNSGVLISGTYTRDSTEDIIIWGDAQGGSVIVEPLSVKENGTYPAPSGKAYSPVTVNVPSSGSWHNINDPNIATVDDILGGGKLGIVSFRMDTSLNGFISGFIQNGDGDGGTTVSACGMKNVDYWNQPEECFFDTGFDIGYTNELTWSDIATSILNAYNRSTGGSETFASFEIYY